MKYRWLLYFTVKALRQRPQRVILMVISISLAVGLLISMIVLETGMRTRLSEELASYGANALVTSRDYLDGAVVELLKKVDGVVDLVPELYGKVCLSDRGLGINIIGMPVEGTKGIKIYGEGLRDGILIGRRLAEGGGFRIGERIKLSKICGQPQILDKTITRVLTIEGIFERVGPEDSAIIMELSKLQEFLGLGNRISVVMLRIEPEQFGLVIEKLKKRFPEFEIKPIRQVAGAEESLLKKIQMLIFIVSIVVVSASIISTAGIMAANIFERLIDIGLMKTIGATTRQIQAFFVLEASVVGIVSSFLGFLSGILSAEFIALSAFGKMVNIPLWGLPVSLLSGFIITIVSSIPPIRNVTAFRPSIILRGQI